MLAFTTKAKQGASSRTHHTENSTPWRPQYPKVQQILRRSRIQAKLKVGAPNDKYEHQADHVADRVMRMPEPSLQRQAFPADEEEEEVLQAKPLPGRTLDLTQGVAEAIKPAPLQVHR